jgi:ABC-type sugar transport system ATPase subunit
MVSTGLQTSLEQNITDRDNVLDVSHLTAEGLIEDINLTVGRGEIVGVAGVLGAGKSELAKAIFGALPKTIQVSGSISINGKAFDPGSMNPGKATRLGIGFVTEDRQGEGIVPDQSVLFNTVLPALHRVVIALVFIPRLAKKVSHAMVDEVRLKPPDIHKRLRFFSGGNQQKAVIGKWLAAQASLLILDEPTRGVDVGAREEIYSVIRRQSKERGLGVLLLSSDLMEIMLASDRILVMRQGRMTQEVFPHQTSAADLLAMVLGEVPTSASIPLGPAPVGAQGRQTT